MSSGRLQYNLSTLLLLVTATAVILGLLRIESIRWAVPYFALHAGLAGVSGLVTARTYRGFWKGVVYGLIFNPISLLTTLTGAVLWIGITRSTWSPGLLLASVPPVLLGGWMGGCAAKRDAKNE